MSGLLTKTRSVLTLSAVAQHYVQFAQWDEEVGGLEKLVQFDFESWNDMGCPHQITVTVEPGDKLNEDPS